MRKPLYQQVKDLFKYKEPTNAEAQANPANIKVGLKTVNEVKKQKKKQMDDFKKELGNS